MKAIMQASLYSLKKVALARNSSILRPFRDRTLAKIVDGKGGFCFIFRSLCRTPPFLPRLRNGLVLFLVMPGGKSMLDKSHEIHDVHGCLKPVNTHGLYLVRHDGRSTLELKLTAQ